MPLGARVLTKNPRRWEFDDSLAEPNEETWRKVTLSLELANGGRFEAELLRPASWVENNGLSAYHQIPFQIDELDAKGLALIESIEPCPPIASGEGSVVTARFKTERHNEAFSQVEFTDSDGRSEQITGTSQHPVWSVDRNNWIGLGDLVGGERVAAQDGPVLVTCVEQLLDTSTVYNIEVAGEHVYQVGELGVLAHNACNPLRKSLIDAWGEGFMKGYQAAHVIPKIGWKWAGDGLQEIIKNVKNAGLIDDVYNGFASTAGHAGTHTKKYVQDVVEIMKDRVDPDDIMAGIDELWGMIKAGKYL